MLEESLFDKFPDSFIAHDGNKYLSIRSIVYDSWITWQDAIPFSKDQHQLLTSEIHNNIIELATKIHKLHQSFPNYKTLTEPPFEFVLWWDPLDKDPAWNQGKTCRFMIDEFTSADIEYYNSNKKNSRLSVKPLTRRLVEVTLST